MYSNNGEKNERKYEKKTEDTMVEQKESGAYNGKECNRNHPRQLKRRISRSIDNQYRCQRGEQDKQPVSINYMLLQSAEHNKKNPQLQKQ